MTETSLTWRFAPSSPASGRGETTSLLPLAGEDARRADEGLSLPYAIALPLVGRQKKKLNHKAVGTS